MSGLIVAWILGAAWLMVWTGAFLPLSAKVYGTRDPHVRIEAVQTHPSQWLWHHVFFFIGVTGLPAAPFAFALQQPSATDPSAAFALGAGLFIAAGAVSFDAFAVGRYRTPPDQWFSSQRGVGLFNTYTATTIAGILLFGMALYVEGAIATGWLVGGLVATATTVAVWAWLKDVPPFLHYAAAAVYAVACLVS